LFASHDAYEVAQRYELHRVQQARLLTCGVRFWEFSQFSTQPIGLVLSSVLIWRLIGWPCLIGVVTVFAAQAINAIITRVLLRWERRRREASDVKLQIISQFVEAIRHLRWYGWQDAWLSKIMAARQHELNLRVVTSIWGILISFTNTFANGMFPVAAFYAYTYLAGQPLRIDIAFPALQLFSMLSTNLREIPGLITALLNAYIAVERLDVFMNEPDKVEAKQSSSLADQLELRNASFAWPGTPTLVLQEISLAFPPGLTIVCGKVAAGKSALLQALLGELDQREGELMRPTQMFGYCAQTPWLQSMSLRENILFSSPYDESRYKRVISACVLTEDLANFKHGDLSNIGENGIGLSGGQKARVALARAIYSQAGILLLDDPLSALDQQTAELVVERCLRSSLLAGKIVVLVTHRTDLCHGLAKQSIEIEAGKARIVTQESDPAHILSLPRPSESAEKCDSERETKQQLAAVPDKFIEDEHRSSGGVKAQVYWTYIKAGKLRWWLILVCVLSLYRLIAVGQTWFLKQWGEAYDPPEAVLISDPFERLPSPELNIRPWLIAFFVITATQAVMFLLTRCVMLIIIYTAGRRMFIEIMRHVSYATFRFYDVTPVGRLMNRLTSDIGTVDGNISEQFHTVVWLLIDWVSSVVVIASITPGFLVFSCALTVGFALIFLRFLPTSQSLRRLEVSAFSVQIQLGDAGLTGSSPDGFVEPAALKFWCSIRGPYDHQRQVPAWFLLSGSLANDSEQHFTHSTDFRAV
jgi:ABC-type multidrug transport system fused ATPase/permease subunit